jgi:uncharacterized protein (TIGR02646 family)
MLDTGPAGRRRLGDRSHYEQTAVVRVPFPPHWTEPDVKGLLYAMQGSVCAYCGMEISLDVDHFRPKGAVDEDQPHGGYWWLAYECSNYLLACTVCNRRKRSRFPILQGATRCTYHTRSAMGTEKRVLLEPSEDPVEEWLKLDQPDVTGRLVPNPNLAADDRQRVKFVIDFFRLNRDPRLRRSRSNAYELAARAAAEQRWDDLRRSAMRHRPHSLAARVVLEKVAPERLPSAEDEMLDLIDSLWSDLRLLLNEGRARAPNPVDERELHEFVWALIVLRNDPPAGDPASTAEYLSRLLEREQAETQKEIVRLFRECATQGT